MGRQTYGATQAAPPALVLVVDADPAIHDLVDTRLRQGSEPVEVMHAMDADTGWRFATERRPDVILCDLDMPGHDGLEMCRTLQSDPRLRTVPVLFLTSTNDVATKVRAFEAGASDYVTKPFDAIELRARVHAALRMTKYRYHLERAAQQRETLLMLSGSAESTWNERMRAILKADATTLGVQRVSYWRMIEDGQAIECEGLYRSDLDRFESGLVLRAPEYPRYFRALHSAKPIIANDARKHMDTSEFTERYLELTGIGAMMDVPVFVRGSLVGVVCHEHVGGVRAWAVDEQQFAVSIGQMLSLARESDDRLRAEEALKISEGRFRAIAQVSPVPMLVSTLSGRSLWGNTALSRLSGVSEEAIRGKQVPDFYANPKDRELIVAELRDKGFVERREVRLRRANGEEYWAMLSGQTLVFDDEPAVLVGLVDLTEQKRMEDILRHTALHDALTALPNRALLFDVLRREIGRAQRDAQYRFALLYFDLDGFKPINDVHGHDVGDQLLVSIARRVTECLRPMDVAARVGGDEFAVVIADIQHEDEAALVAARIERAITETHRVGGRELHVGASIGIQVSDPQLVDASAMVRAADEAMYEKKRDKSRRTAAASP